MENKTKKETRQNMIMKRNLLSKEEIAKKSQLILKKLLDTKEYRKAQSIFIFVSFGSEVDTREAISKMIEDGKEIYVPKVVGKLDMKAIKIDTIDKLVRNKMGILEPLYGIEAKINDINLVVVPGVAFDKRGYRIGYGGGYYDSFLAKLSSDVSKIGIAYDLQMIEEIDNSVYDIKIDSLITESYFINF